MQERLALFTLIQPNKYYFKKWALFCYLSIPHNDNSIRHLNQNKCRLCDKNYHLPYKLQYILWNEHQHISIANIYRKYLSQNDMEYYYNIWQEYFQYHPDNDKNYTIFSFWVVLLALHNCISSNSNNKFHFTAHQDSAMSVN